MEDTQKWRASPLSAVVQFPQDHMVASYSMLSAAELNRSAISFVSLYFGSVGFEHMLTTNCDLYWKSKLLNDENRRNRHLFLLLLIINY